MARGFGDAATEDFYHGRWSARARRIPFGVAAVALRKLDMLYAAARLVDLAAPPGNRLEALRGELRGWYSIRVNEQWRIVFRWTERGADDVTIVDYH